MTKWTLCMTMGLVLAAAAARGDEKAAAKKASTTVAAGATVTDGNSEQFVGNASVVHERADDVNRLRLGAEINYSEIGGDVTNENWKAFADYRRTLQDRMYAVAGYQYLHDDAASVEWRHTVSAGLGYYWLKHDQATLGTDVGPAYVWEKVAGVEDDYAALRFAERYDRTLSDTSKCWQSLEFLPRADDFGDYILTAEIGAEAVLSGPISLRLVVQDTYDSEPAPGKEENDLKVIGALTYTL